MPTRAPKHSTAAAAAAMMDPTSARAEETQALARDVQDGASDSGSAESKEPEYMYYYQKHGGDMRFCCGGRCMIGPKIDNEYMAFAWLAILVPSGVYFGWAAPLLWENWGPRLPVSAASLLVATVVSMLATMFTDPGFIMKNGQVRAAPSPAVQAPAAATPCSHHVSLALAVARSRRRRTRPRTIYATRCSSTSAQT
jgi:hypothetical protein